MKYTYKLDSRGIPYRVVQQEAKEEAARSPKSRLFSGILPHSGIQKNFHLYIF